MPSEPPRLTIIIPAFNEAPRIVDCAGHLKDALAAGILSSRGTQMILVDDGSTDGTADRAEEILAPMFQRLRVIRLDHNVGKGAAVRAGVTAAEEPVVLFVDADMSVTPSDLPAFVNALRSADIAIGSRSVPDSVVESHSIQRRVMGRTFNRLVRSVTGLPFWDTQCGMKAFRTPAARLLFHLTRSQRFAFDVEALFLAGQLGMRTSEVGVNWHEREGSSVRLLADPLSMLYDIANLRWRKERPSVPALAITRRNGVGVPSPESRHEVSCALGARHPILLLPDDCLLVLLPLCGAVTVERTADRLRTLPDLEVDERTISFSNLREIVLFGWLPDGDAGKVRVSHPEMIDCVASPPARWSGGHPNGNGHIARVHPA